MQPPDRILQTVCLLGLLACLPLPAWLGCSREQPAGPSAKTAPATAAATAPSDPAPTDADDAPNAPRALPDTGELAGWIKIEPIRQASLGTIRLEPWWDPAIAAQSLASYQIDRIWTCTYASKPGIASVVFFETSDPLDAFGLFSLLTRKPGITARPEDGTMLESRMLKDAVAIVGWQGTACVAVQVSGFSDAEGLPAAERLARRILFAIPWADPPFIMRSMPRTQLANTKIWMVRRTAALQLATEDLRRIARAGLDDVFGLTDKDLLWIAAIEQPADTRPASERTSGEPSPRNIIWIAEYAAPEKSRQAFDRYLRRLSRPTTDVDRQTQVQAPHGRYLIGTWTAGAEKANPVLPALLDMLPAADAATSLSASIRPAGSTQ